MTPCRKTPINLHTETAPPGEFDNDRKPDNYDFYDSKEELHDRTKINQRLQWKSAKCENLKLMTHNKFVLIRKQKCLWKRTCWLTGASLTRTTDMSASEARCYRKVGRLKEEGSTHSIKMMA